MAKEVQELLAHLSDADRAMARAPLDDPGWTRWTYLPGDRPGLPLETAPTEVLDQVERLVGLAHGEHGAALVHGAVEVERERRRRVAGTPPDGDRYRLQVLGDPDADTWAWRLNGHHVGVHVAVKRGADGVATTLTPHFIGAEPALTDDGPWAGRRLLGPEEDLARDLLARLRPSQRDVAVAADVAPDDILTGADPVADPAVLPTGIRRGDLDEAQRAAFDALVRRYLDRAPTEYADACWEEAVHLGADDMAFAWAGSTQVGAPHYYCVRTPMFLIEYDNTQDDANHAHSVWRHLRDDFGGDALRRHRREAHQ